MAQKTSSNDKPLWWGVVIALAVVVIAVAWWGTRRSQHQAERAEAQGRPAGVAFSDTTYRDTTTPVRPNGLNLPAQRTNGPAPAQP